MPATHSNETDSAGSYVIVEMALRSAFVAVEENYADFIAKRTVRNKRHLSHGAIAGTVVACVVALFLLTICLYPFLIRRWRSSKRSSGLPLDTENGMTQASWAAGAGEHPAQPSSSDSFKRNELSPRDLDVGSKSAQRYENNEAALATGEERPRQPPIRVDANTSTHTSAHNPTLLQEGELSYSPFEQEFFPASTADPEPGILKGTSADYYSPSIPSELFGMTAEPLEEGGEELGRTSITVSRSSSIMQMLRGRSSRNRTMSGTSKKTSMDHASPFVPRLDEASPTKISKNEEDLAASAATSTQMSLPPDPAMISSIASGEAAQTSPQSPPRNRSLQSSPSPPTHPAPGTVNPMDIMPASSRTETYYHAEQALNNFNSSPPLHDSAKFSTNSYNSAATSQPPQSTDLVAAHSSLPTVMLPFQNMLEDHNQEVDKEDAMAIDTYPPTNSIELALQESDRRASMTSEVSTLLHGTQFTDPSSHNTPATQIDSPMSQSLNGSDFRNSESPQIGTGIPSPKDGRYYCNRCDRSFTQHHKLNHHQRYHTKTHKCTYPGCDHSFGTKTHLQRHINDRHERTKKFHCAISDCEYSRAGGKGFPRKDNWKRHMMKKHNIAQQHLPDPVSVDA